MRLLLPVALLLAIAHVWVGAASPRPSGNVEGRGSLESAVIKEINRVRVSRGLARLSPAPRLRSAARGHSHAMLVLGFFAHDSADGTPFNDRIKRYYPNRGWHRWSVGETLLARQGGEPNARDVVTAWLDSPPHRKLILSPTFREAGVGALYAPSAPRAFGGAATVVVTADFGLRTGRAASP